MSSRSVRTRPGADAASVHRPVLTLAAALVLVLSLAGCAAPTPPRGLTELLAQPGERALLDGMRAYDDGQYAAAEIALRQALDLGLASARDRAGAHKLLAFIQCTSERIAACEDEFRAARAADPGFTLGRAEAGHPLWGPVYRRVLP
jgi:Tfp pilus assembly protein PilF